MPMFQPKSLTDLLEKIGFKKVTSPPYDEKYPAFEYNHFVLDLSGGYVVSRFFRQHNDPETVIRIDTRLSAGIPSARYGKEDIFASILAMEDLLKAVVLYLRKKPHLTETIHKPLFGPAYTYYVGSPDPDTKITNFCLQRDGNLIEFFVDSEPRSLSTRYSRVMDRKDDNPQDQKYVTCCILEIQSVLSNLTMIKADFGFYRNTRKTRRINPPMQKVTLSHSFLIPVSDFNPDRQTVRILKKIPTFVLSEKENADTVEWYSFVLRSLYLQENAEDVSHKNEMPDGISHDFQIRVNENRTAIIRVTSLSGRGVLISKPFTDTMLPVDIPIKTKANESKDDAYLRIVQAIVSTKLSQVMMARKVTNKHIKVTVKRMETIHAPVPQRYGEDDCPSFNPGRLLPEGITVL